MKPTMKGVYLLVQLCATVFYAQGAATDPCELGGSYCPDGKTCQSYSCVWPPYTPLHVCTSIGEVCATGRKCIPCYLRDPELCCRRADLLGAASYCGEKYRDSYNQWQYGTFCPDGKVCSKHHGKYSCNFATSQPSCLALGQICGVAGDRSCVSCYFLSGLCCRRRSKLGAIASECQYGGTNCPAYQTCQQSVAPNGVITRTCV